MTQQLSSPPEQPQHTSQPLPKAEPRFPRIGIVSVLILIVLLLILFTGLSIHNVPQLVALAQSTATPGITPTSPQTPQATATPTSIGPVQIPGNAVATHTPTPTTQYILYEQQQGSDPQYGLYLIPATGGTPQLLNTPGYIYSRSVSPVLTKSGQILYSGNGLWLIDPFQGNPHQIATISADDVITSMVLNSDGSMVAWSTEPKDGNGQISVHAGFLDSTQNGTTQNSTQAVVYQQSAANCPCFRVFSFLNGSGQNGHTTLLLTDDRGDHREVQYGLWTLDLSLSHAPTATPQPTATSQPTATPQPMAIPQLLLDEDTLQMPLALVPGHSLLLYSTYGGIVPEPTNESVPDDIAALNYANNLSFTPISGKPLTLGTVQTILPEQHGLSSIAEYHWVFSPQFSPDARTLVYVVFSSDNQLPFNRHSAVYTVNISGTGSHMRAGVPQLLATASSHFVELGVWLDNHTLTLYADGVLYTLDIHNGTLTAIQQFASGNSYAHIVASLMQKQDGP